MVQANPNQRPTNSRQRRRANQRPNPIQNSKWKVCTGSGSGGGGGGSDNGSGSGSGSGSDSVTDWYGLWFDVCLIAGAESEGESESEFELSAEEEAAEEAAEEDEFDSDIELDESDEAESDAETEQTLQSYAESSGAVDSESLSDAEHALESLSSAVAVSEAEAEMDAEKAGGKSKSKKGGKNKKSKKAVALSGMKMSQLNLRDDKGEGIKINLAQGKGRYSMGVNAAGVFGVDMEGRVRTTRLQSECCSPAVLQSCSPALLHRSALIVTDFCDVDQPQNILSVSGKSGMVRARGDVTVWNTLSAGSLTLNQVPQYVWGSGAPLRMICCAD